jgi:23S rRNA (cytosine1962-C5)-methyltransferase
LRSLSLSKSGINKIRSRQFELKVSDLEDSIKSMTPGEWCLVKTTQSENWLCFVNPLIDEKYPCVHVLTFVNEDNVKNYSLEMFISQKITDAFQKRLRFLGYESNSRIFYGVSDGLPGLIIDQFENASIIQINTAGVDRFRQLVKDEVEKITKKRSYFLDNEKYREKESLPIFSTEAVPDLVIFENQLTYKVRSAVIQKVGFYFDHRENRYQLINLLSRLSIKFKRGIDLFSYVGAWGLSALRGGVDEMHFVDQGDFQTEVNEALILNDFSDKGTYHRSDVFKFLDEEIRNKKFYDLVLCDPPAFAKSLLQKPQALEGYSKLHRKVFKIISSGGLAVFSSCTHYVNHDEFQKNILEASMRENRKIQLVFSGLQGFDHPINGHENRSNYIKSYFYLVE